MQRRRLIKSIGVSSLGISGMTGTALARETRESNGVSSGLSEDFDPNDVPVDVEVKQFEADDGMLTLSLAEHEETGEQYAVALPTPGDQVSAQSSGEISLPTGESGMQSVSPESAQKLIAEQKTDTFSAQRTNTVLDELWDRLPTHQEDWVVDATGFVNEDCCSSPDFLGTDPDYHFGASVELTDTTISLGEAAIAGIVGALLSAAAAQFVAPVIGTLPAAALGGLAAATASFAIDNFKRSNYISVSARDTVLSQWVPGYGTASVAATNLSVSGQWDDQRESSKPTFGYLVDHQGSIVQSATTSLPVYTSASDLVEDVV